MARYMVSVTLSVFVSADTAKEAYAKAEEALTTKEVNGLTRGSLQVGKPARISNG